MTNEKRQWAATAALTVWAVAATVAGGPLWGAWDLVVVVVLDALMCWDLVSGEKP